MSDTRPVPQLQSPLAQARAFAARALNGPGAWTQDVITLAAVFQQREEWLAALEAVLLSPKTPPNPSTRTRNVNDPRDADWLATCWAAPGENEDGEDGLERTLRTLARAYVAVRDAPLMTLAPTSPAGPADNRRRRASDQEVRT